MYEETTQEQIDRLYRKIFSLIEERDMLADENKNFSEYLSNDWCYSQRQIEEVARTGHSPTPQEDLDESI